MRALVGCVVGNFESGLNTEFTEGAQRSRRTTIGIHRTLPASGQGDAEFAEKYGEYEDRIEQLLRLRFLGAFLQQFGERGGVEVVQALEAHAALADIGFRESLLVMLDNVCRAIGCGDIQRNVARVAGQADPKPISFAPAGILQAAVTVGEHPGLNEWLEFRGFADELVKRGDVGFTRLFELRDVLAGVETLSWPFMAQKTST